MAGEAANNQGAVIREPNHITHDRATRVEVFPVNFFRRVFVFSLISLAGVSGTQRTQSQTPSERPTGTKVVLLGTGTPVPDPDRSGPATAIVVGDTAYLVDFGPGVVRRAESAALNRKIPAVEPGNLKVAFVTHLRCF
jgi:hypothetical protein